MLLTKSWKSQKLKKLTEMSEYKDSRNLVGSPNLSLHKERTDAIYPQTQAYPSIMNLHNLLG